MGDIVKVERTPLRFLTRNQKNIKGDYAFCIDTSHTGGIKETRTDGTLRIRKYTPKECFRLMGFEDDDFEKAAALNSNTQLYKQAGNSIVVQCCENILKQLFACGVLEIENEVKQMYFTDDPVADFHRYDAERESELARLPKCDKCKNRIQDEYLYEIEGQLLCEGCMKDLYRHEAEEYML